VFAQALIEIVRRLDEAKTRQLLEQYALIGGFAVSAWGVPRATHDVDFALALGASDAAALSRFLQAEFQPGESDDPLRGVFRTSVSIGDQSIPVQLILLPQVWNAIVFQDLESLSLFGCLLPVVSWRALVLLKLYAGGPQDMLDAQQIVAVRQPTPPERETVAALAERVGLAGAWQSLIRS
jgi:hypothetical protein